MDCTLWKGSKHPNGYGLMRVKELGKVVYAHRFVYCKVNSVSLESIKGLVVRHKCDNPLCVNPDHLEIGTQADNIQDRVDRGRSSAPKKISDEDAQRIRDSYTGKYGEQSRLAREFGVSQAAIHYIINNRNLR